MKKILLFLALFILSIPLFSSVTFTEEVGDDVRLLFETEINKAVGERKEPIVVISDYREEEEVIYCTLSINGKNVDFVSPGKYFSNTIDSVFYYEKSLYEDGEILDYIYKGTFSSVSLSNPKRGQNYAVLSPEGKARALFLVDSVYDNAAVLSPFRLSDLLPGMKLERVNDFSLSIKAFSDIKLRSCGASVSLFYSSLIYPLIPFVEFTWIGGSGNSFYSLIGASVFFSLGRVWSGIPVIRNIVVSGDVALGAQYSSSLKFTGKYSVNLSYTFTRYFSLSASLINYGGNFYYSLGALVKL